MNKIDELEKEMLEIKRRMNAQQIEDEEKWNKINQIMNEIKRDLSSILVVKTEMESLKNDIRKNLAAEDKTDKLIKRLEQLKILEIENNKKGENAVKLFDAGIERTIAISNSVTIIGKHCQKLEDLLFVIGNKTERIMMKLEFPTDEINQFDKAIVLLPLDVKKLKHTTGPQ